MFQGLVAEHGRCVHCGKARWVASIPTEAGALPYSEAPPGEVLKLCAGCIYKLTRLAALLVKLEAAPKKKAPRKPVARRRPATPAPPIGPFDHDELEPASENRSRMP